MPGPTTKPRKNPYVKAIAAYYAALKDFEFQHVIHESATRSAFQTLLAEAARINKWTLVPELGDKFKGKTIRPDCTLKDFMNLPRGHWEAKDTSDRLDEEIAKRIKSFHRAA
jgi:hypothetical protein